jgi:hypothetical protein
VIQDNDLSMGHVVPSVYNQVKRETPPRRSAQPVAILTLSMVAASQRPTVIRPIWSERVA